MIERRRDTRIDVDFWASLKHPLLGTVTGEVQDMSTSGALLTLDQQVNFFIMMELDVRIHGEGWHDSMPTLPVQVIRVNQRKIALRFLDKDLPLVVEQLDDIELSSSGDEETSGLSNA